MADWVAVSVDLCDDPKVARFAAGLRLSLPEAVVYLLRLWSAMARHGVEDGNLSEVDDSVLEIWAHWPGKRGKFAQAFRDAFTVGGVVNGWWRWNGRHLRAARKNREDSNAWREQLASGDAAVGGPSPGGRYLYAMTRPSDGAIKIGISRSPTRRVRELSAESGSTYGLLGFRPGTLAHEQRAHTDLASEALGGEWFRPSDKTRQWVSHWLASGPPLESQRDFGGDYPDTGTSTRTTQHTTEAVPGFAALFARLPEVGGVRVAVTEFLEASPKGRERGWIGVISACLDGLDMPDGKPCTPERLATVCRDFLTKPLGDWNAKFFRACVAAPERRGSAGPGSSGASERSIRAAADFAEEGAA